MPPRQLRYPLDELVRRGQEIYQQQIRPLVEEGNRGKIVAIDIDSGAFEVADIVVTAGNRLFARFPNAQVFYVRIGYPAVDRFSYFPPKEDPA
jgi:hypothetical protein